MWKMEPTVLETDIDDYKSYLTAINKAYQHRLYGSSNVIISGEVFCTISATDDIIQKTLDTLKRNHRKMIEQYGQIHRVTPISINIFTTTDRAIASVMVPLPKTKDIINAAPVSRQETQIVNALNRMYEMKRQKPNSFAGFKYIGCRNYLTLFHAACKSKWTRYIPCGNGFLLAGEKVPTVYLTTKFLYARDVNIGYDATKGFIYRHKRIPEYDEALKQWVKDKYQFPIVKYMNTKKIWEEGLEKNDPVRKGTHKRTLSFGSSEVSGRKRSSWEVENQEHDTHHGKKDENANGDDDNIGSPLGSESVSQMKPNKHKGGRGRTPPKDEDSHSPGARHSQSPSQSRSRSKSKGAKRKAAKAKAKSRSKHRGSGRGRGRTVTQKKDAAAKDESRSKSRIGHGGDDKKKATSPKSTATTKSKGKGKGKNKSKYTKQLQHGDAGKGDDSKTLEHSGEENDQSKPDDGKDDTNLSPVVHDVENTESHEKKKSKGRKKKSPQPKKKNDKSKQESVHDKENHDPDNVGTDNPVDDNVSKGDKMEEEPHGDKTDGNEVATAAVADKKSYNTSGLVDSSLTTANVTGADQDRNTLSSVPIQNETTESKKPAHAGVRPLESTESNASLTKTTQQKKSSQLNKMNIKIVPEHQGGEEEKMTDIYTTLSKDSTAPTIIPLGYGNVNTPGETLGGNVNDVAEPALVKKTKLA